jgi:hypothetical protein
VETPNAVQTKAPGISRATLQQHIRRRALISRVIGDIGTYVKKNFEFK